MEYAYKNKQLYKKPHQYGSLNVEDGTISAYAMPFCHKLDKSGDTVYLKEYDLSPILVSTYEDATLVATGKTPFDEERYYQLHNYRALEGISKGTGLPLPITDLVDFEIDFHSYAISVCGPKFITGPHVIASVKLINGNPTALKLYSGKELNVPS